MTPSKFYKQLGLITAGTVAILILLHSYTVFGETQVFSWLSLGFFFSLSLLMYLMGRKSAVSSDKNAFTTLIMVFIFSKMLLSVLIVVVYVKTAEPQSKLFVVPFFLVYLIYTIFETNTLMIVGRTKMDKV